MEDFVQRQLLVSKHPQDVQHDCLLRLHPYQMCWGPVCALPDAVQVGCEDSEFSVQIVCGGCKAV